jgi:hypothetical protein
LVDARPHLGRGLVRERDGKDREGRHLILDQVGYPVCENARLTGTGPRDDEGRSTFVRHRLALNRVELL